MWVYSVSVRLILTKCVQFAFLHSSFILKSGHSSQRYYEFPFLDSLYSVVQGQVANLQILSLAKKVKVAGTMRNNVKLNYEAGVDTFREQMVESAMI